MPSSAIGSLSGGSFATALLDVARGRLPEVHLPDGLSDSARPGRRGLTVPTAPHSHRADERDGDSICARDSSPAAAEKGPWGVQPLSGGVKPESMKLS